MLAHPWLGQIFTSIGPLFILFLAVTAVARTDASFTVSSNENLDKAVAYLRKVAYNPDLRLCREAPRVAANVYWVASDNLLAYKALEPYDQELASKIRSELVRIAKHYNLPTSKEDLPLSLRYDVAMTDDATLDMSPRTVTHITLYNDSYLLRYDVANGTDRINDWRGYADLRLLVALSDHNRGDDVNAVSNFTAAANMWDGIGLRDNAYVRPYGEGQAQGTPNAYATYKLGLFLYASGRLGIRLSFEQDVMDRIWSMQNQTSGGVFTHIMPNGGHGDSDTNTETTALVILGITRIHLSTIPWFFIGAFTIMVVALVTLTIVVLAIRRKRGRIYP